VTAMKKTLLTGITALFLATGTAHAYPPRYYDCGKALHREIKEICETAQRPM